MPDAAREKYKLNQTIGDSDQQGRYSTLGEKGSIMERFDAKRTSTQRAKDGHSLVRLSH